MQLELETERLILRPLRESDLDLGLELFTDPEVMRYIGSVETPASIRGGIPVWCRRCGDGCIGVWVAIDRAANEKIGTGILLPLPIDLEDTDWSLVDGGDIRMTRSKSGTP